MQHKDDGPSAARAGDQDAVQSGRYRTWSTDRILSRIAVLQRKLTNATASQQPQASGRADDDDRRLHAELAALRRELVRREGAP